MEKLASTFAFICIVIAMVGCSRTDSENVTSNGIYADMELVARATGVTKIKVRLRVGGSLSLTELELSGSDHLLAHANGTTKTLTEFDEFLDISYKTSFNTIGDDAEFRIEFDRGNAVSAPNSIVTLPQGFNLSTLGGPNYLRDQNITVAWEPAFTQDAMSIKFKATCRTTNGGIYTDSGTRHVGDSGHFTINAAELIGSDPIFDDADCEIDIQVDRKRNGSVDSHYGEGGKIVASQRRSIKVYIPSSSTN